MNKLYMVLAFVLVGALAFAQTSSDVLISSSSVTSMKDSWLSAAAVAVPGLLGILGIKMAADFVVRRAQRFGK